ncbi:hypothetical protein CHL76_13085 [Marinococcus halophilus]|uniref:Uncharacterized protein n=1 Tax=Marinococcus halophilus TaxID=1371 RepID=A0A510YB62_MARHA|nr:hypothetical protein CHL76_13085 [Marinococcus halophilus]GEK59607.1 hypothetical protein MHA01_25120 [Marinococcus halophilus]
MLVLPGRIVNIRIPLDGQASGEKEDGKYTFGFQFPQWQGKGRYANGVKKRARMIFYAKDEEGRLIFQYPITEIQRQDHCVISTRYEKRIPGEFQKEIRQIIIHFV